MRFLEINLTDDLIRLTPEQIKNILDKGFCYIEISPGHTVKVTEKDLVFKKEELDEYLKKMREENQ